MEPISTNPPRSFQGVLVCLDSILVLGLEELPLKTSTFLKRNMMKYDDEYDMTLKPPFKKRTNQSKP